MACRKPWERSQLIDMLPKSFVHGGLTKWRKEILFERERGMMPATIPLIAAKRAVRDLAPLRHQVRAQLRACRNIYSTVAEINQSTTSGNYDPSSERHRLLLSRLETFGLPFDEPAADYMAKYLRHMDRIEREYEHIGAYITHATRSIADGTVPISWEEYHQNMEDAYEEDPNAIARPRQHTSFVATYIRPCPVADCRGFLAAQTHACGLCDARVSKDCHELLGEGDHECLPDNVASAKLILKDTRPCPKCAVRIYKIDGCDQMWCSSCHTAFSWRTGEIETKRVHNPHYYAWMRDHNGGVPREPGDGPGGCEEDAMVSYYHVLTWLQSIIQYQDIRRRRGMRGRVDVADPEADGRMDLGDLISGIHQNMAHCREYELAYYRVRERHLLNHDVRIDYLENKIGEAEYKRELHRREKKNNKMRAIHQVIEMYVNVQEDLFRNHIATSDMAAVEALRDESAALVAYTNTCFVSVANQYNNVAPRITLVRHHYKFVRWGHDDAQMHD